MKGELCRMGLGGVPRGAGGTAMDVLAGTGYTSSN